jgi:hypothetical protein
VEDNGVDMAREQAQNAFLNDLNSTRNYTVDPEFLNVANFTPVRNFGG